MQNKDCCVHNRLICTLNYRRVVSAGVLEICVIIDVLRCMFKLLLFRYGTVAMACGERVQGWTVSFDRLIRDVRSKYIIINNRIVRSLH